MNSEIVLTVDEVARPQDGARQHRRADSPQSSTARLETVPLDALEPIDELAYNAPEDEAALAAAMSAFIDAVIVPVLVAKFTQGEWT